MTAFSRKPGISKHRVPYREPDKSRLVTRLALDSSKPHHPVASLSDAVCARRSLCVVFHLLKGRTHAILYYVQLVYAANREVPFGLLTALMS